MLVRRVVGTSMLPAVRPGTIIVARNKAAAVGDIVVARLGRREVVKRVQAIGSGRVFLVGDNESGSTDSRQLGPVSKTDILGVVIMKFFARRALPAPPIKRRGLLLVPYLFASLVTVMLLLQLFEFEDFVPLMEGMTGGQTAGRIVAVLVICVELFSLPFLIRMKLSPLARAASGFLSVTVPLLWLAAVIIRPSGNIGLFGTKVPIESGMANLLLASVIAGLSLASFYILHGPALVGIGSRRRR